MIDTIRAYGVSNEAIFKALRAVPRHLFVSEDYQDVAYGDHPVPIGREQTISQPYTVAMMLDELELHKGQKVLEIGAGSGWNAALISEIVDNGKVFSIECIPELAKRAQENLKKVDSKATILEADGSLGYEKNAPYDRIIVTCACPEIPGPLIEQLKEGGIIIAPVGWPYQNMIKAVKDDELKTQNLGSFAFVKLRGKYGF